MTATKVGDIVRHPAKPEWGRGVVVDVKGNKLQLFFENLTGEAAVKLDTSRVSLEVLVGEEAPLLGHLAFKEIAGKIILDERRVSFDDLFRHFVKICPGGFADEKLLREEISFKQRARQAFVEHFGDGRGAELLAAGNAEAIQAGFGAILNVQEALLSPKFERTPFWGAMTIADNAVGFARGLFGYLDRPLDAASFDCYVASLEAVKLTGNLRVTTWPLLTLFPFLARPDLHMFLKPDVTKKAAGVIGINLAYESELNWTTYSHLLRLCDVVDGELAKRGLHPRDHIETQSFIWVAVTYP